MAGLQRKGDSWYCTFRYLGNRHTFTIGPVPDDIAEATGRKVDLLLYRLKNRLIEIPSGVSVVDFVQFDGKPASAPQPGDYALSDLRDKYLDTHRSSLEKTTLDGIELHFGYFVETWGERFAINGLSLLKLQEYVDAPNERRWDERSQGFRGDHQEGNRDAPHRLELGEASEDREGGLPLRGPALSANDREAALHDEGGNRTPHQDRRPYCR